jgi:hypothetical protein
MNLAANIVSSSYSALLKSPVLILMGAGASAPFGTPTMAKFTDLIDPTWHKMATQIISGNSTGENDLEFLLGRVALYETISQERGRDSNLQSWINFANHQPCASAHSFKEHIFSRIIERYGKLSKDNQDKACKIYLPLFRGLRRLSHANASVLPIFTTNYDLIPEALGEGDPKAQYCTGMKTSGFVGKWDPTLYASSDYDYGVFRLHGCSHWMRDKRSGEIFFQALPDTQAPERREPCVLYPLPGKESRLSEDPFRQAYQYFERCLENVRTIVIIGYSGRDPSVQAAIFDSLENDRNKHVIIVTHGTDLRGGLNAIRERCTNCEHLTGGIESSVDMILASVGRLETTEDPSQNKDTPA